MFKTFFVGVVFLSLVIFSFRTLAQTTELDQRAMNYYSEQQVAELSDLKIKQINYLYSNSFVVPEEMQEKINPEEIDVRKYSKRRSKSERVKIYLIAQGETRSEEQAFTENYILLKSIDELKDAYSQLEKGEATK